MSTISQYVAVTYTITFQAPFHAGTGLSAGLIDRVVQRDAEGFLYLPGSTIKGIVREHCEQLARLLLELPPASSGSSAALEVRDPHDEDAAARYDYLEPGLIGRIFGTRVDAGTLSFEDAALTDAWRQEFAPDDTPHPRDLALQTEVRTQVSMSRLTRTAKPGLLFTSEYGLKDLAFQGRIQGYLEDWSREVLAHSEETFALTLLIAGLLSIDRVGGNRSAGYGACRCSLDALTIDQREIEQEALQAFLPALLDHLDDFRDYPTVKEL